MGRTGDRPFALEDEVPLSGKDDKAGICFLTHPSEDEWEEYAFGRLPQSRVERLEEHLFACRACQFTLDRLDKFISAMRTTAAEPAPGTHFIWDRIRFKTRPLIAAALVAGLLVIGVVAMRSRRPFLDTTPVAVALASFRGETMAVAPVRQPLSLEISKLEIPSRQETRAPSAYTLEVVTATGGPAWKGKLERAGDKLIAEVPGGLDRGTYWVRLYGSHADLLREFGLRVGEN